MPQEPNIYNYERKYKNAKNRFLSWDISKKNKDLVLEFERKYIKKAKLDSHYIIDPNKKLPNKDRKLYKITLHTLRHTYGSNFYIASKKDIIATRDALRHKDTRATEKYIHAARLIQEARIHRKMFN